LTAETPKAKAMSLKAIVVAEKRTADSTGDERVHGEVPYSKDRRGDRHRRRCGARSTVGACAASRHPPSHLLAPTEPLAFFADRL
jgi:hypothetical protein